MLKIIKKQDIIPVGNLKILIYGQPGIGKTSLANTAKNPITLDFDRGSHRAIVRNDIIQPQTWQEALEFANSKQQLEGYNTIIIDTIGKALDMIVSSPQVAKTKGGQPTLQGYGTVKQILQNWIKQISLLGKDIVFIAHDKEEKNEDRVLFRPDITGSTLQTLIREVDMMGFLRVVNKKRVLDFNPGDDYNGKNCAGFEALTIQDKYQDGFDMSQIIQKTKEKLETMTEEQKQAIEIIKKYTASIDECEEPNHFQDLLISITKNITQKELQTTLKVELVKKAKSLQIVFDTREKQFIYNKPTEPDQKELDEAFDTNNN